MNTTATGPVGHLRRPSAKTIDEIRAATGLSELDTVVLAVPTITGLPRGKEYDAGYFVEHVLEHGAHAAEYLTTTDVDMRMLPGFSLGGWQHGAGDLSLRADADTLRPAGWMDRSVLILADPCDRSGQPLTVSPRAVLARQVSRLAGLGLTASLGIETEAMVYDIDYRDAHRRGYRNLLPAADFNTDYELARPPRLDGLLGRIRQGAYASRLRLEAVKTEAGPGQIEVTFRHDDPVAAADAQLVYKLLAHHAAASLGAALTFMAKPFTGQDGNSCHLHLSLANGNGTGVLLDADGRLTRTGEHAVAGCLAALGPLALLMLPNVNSYKRLHIDGPPLFAPTSLSWGYDNRTCALRIIGAGSSGRIECRIPGADAQPHLASAALLAAAAHGIEKQLELNQRPASGNAYVHRGAAALPYCLEQARTALEESPLAADLLGADVIAHYARAAEHEAAYHRVRVTDLERERGFARA